MHFVEAKGILSAKGVLGENGMNLYRGCTHGCIYCDSRSKCYHIDHVFEDVEVKRNALELLEDRLRRKRQKCMIGTGSMTDPYIPLEKELEYIRGTLKLVEKYGFGFTLITKSDLVLRDIDLLKKIQEKTKCVVQSPRQAELMKLFHQTCEAAGIMHDNDEIFRYLGTFEEKQQAKQMSLFDIFEIGGGNL